MESIRGYLAEYLRECCSASEYDINESVLCHFMDSLDIIDMVMNIEKKYDINTNDDWYEWGEATVDDIVKYIKEKIE